MLSADLLMKFREKFGQMAQNQHVGLQTNMQHNSQGELVKGIDRHVETQSNKCSGDNQEGITIKNKDVDIQINVEQTQLKIGSSVNISSEPPIHNNMDDRCSDDIKQKGKYVGNQVYSQIKTLPCYTQPRSIVLSSDSQSNNHSDIEAIFHKQPPIPNHLKQISIRTPSHNFYLRPENNDNNYPPISHPEILTDGRNYSQEFRRRFASRLLQASGNLSEIEFKQLVKKQSENINVFAYEIRIWICAYDLIFSVEHEQSEHGKKFAEAELLECIRRYLLAYLKCNQNDKKYKVIKMLHYVFRSFGVPENKAQPWLANLLETSNLGWLKRLRFDHYDILGIRLPKFLQTANRQIMHRIAPQRQRTVRKNRNSSLSLLDEHHKKGGPRAKKNNDALNQALSSYPQLFKNNIAIKFDSALKIAFEKLYKRKSSELCVDGNVLRQIHDKHGHIQIVRGQHQMRQILHRHSTNPQDRIRRRRRRKSDKNQLRKSTSKARPKKTVFINKDYPCENNEYLAKLQEILFYFLETHAQVPIIDLQRQCDAVMDRFVFTDKLKSEVRTKWFAYFLKKYKVHMNQRGFIAYRSPK